MILDKFHNKVVSHDVYVVADDECKQMLNGNQSEISHPAVKLNILDLSKVTSIEGSNNNLFKHCGPVRLYAPQLLADVPQLDRFVYLDSDTLVADSLASTAQQLEDAGNVPFFLSPESNTLPNGTCLQPWYTHFPKIRFGDCGLNSGVFGVNLKMWKEMNLDRRVKDSLADHKKGLIKLHLGDQDVLNYIAKKDSSLVHVMPCNLNQRIDSNCPAEQSSPIILHGNRGIFGNKWKRAKAKLLKAAEALMRDGAKAGDPTGLSQKAGLEHRDTPTCHKALPFPNPYGLCLGQY
eukprot:TRINITY_DN30794_c0_g1_i1.p1 TRINITY_DN30794_c0_g1~~TRINITY_DN30794_c0_g1_i1.p1  ORF type:complete len:292 (-),score=47.38 TRINITY_DN30794_c0_g1_i1:24-899(-)